MRIQTLSLIGAALVALAPGQARAQEAIDRTVPTGATGAVEIVNPAGDIQVVGSSRSEIRITGRLGSGTERLEVENAGGRVSIRVVLPREGRQIRPTQLVVHLPAGKSVVARGISADVEVAGVTGPVEAVSASGDVSVEGNPAQVTARSTSGDVGLRVNTGALRAHSTSGDIDVAGTVRGSATVESVSGDVKMSATSVDLTAKTVSGDLELRGVSRRATASSVSGNVAILASNLSLASLESVSGDLTVQGNVQNDAVFKAQSHSGNVELILPASVSADFQATTFSGQIVNEFGPEARRTSQHTPGKELRFSTGRGGVIDVRTFSGNVRIRRRD